MAASPLVVVLACMLIYVGCRRLRTIIICCPSETCCPTSCSIAAVHFGIVELCLLFPACEICARPGPNSPKLCNRIVISPDFPCLGSFSIANTRLSKLRAEMSCDRVLNIARSSDHLALSGDLKGQSLSDHGLDRAADREWLGEKQAKILRCHASQRINW